MLSSASTQGSRTLNEKRDYQRILPDFKARKELRERGFTWVLSSNVSAVRRQDNNLYIRFHNGSLYEYPNLGNRYEEILDAESKGRWVWNELRRKNVSYRKLGSMPMEDDLDVDDEEVMKIGITWQEIATLQAMPLNTLSSLALLSTMSLEELSLGIPLLK